MLLNVEQRKEILVSVANKIGILADIAEILSDHGINIEAVAGYAMNEEAEVMFVTDDNLRAGDALKKKGYTSIKERDVIMVELENKPGVLKNITKTLAQENINIEYIYGTTGPKICPDRIILSTNDNEKAFVVFKKAITY